MDLLSAEESKQETIDITSPSVTETVGEIKKRRGRPPGSKNKAREETITPSIENAIKGLFGFLSLMAGWFGYEQTEELTDSEAKDGARAFTPIIQKHPWLSPWLAYIGAPVWLLITMRKKFRRKNAESNETNNARPSTDSDSSSGQLVDGRQRFTVPDGSGQTVGNVPPGGPDYNPGIAVHGEEQTSG